MKHTISAFFVLVAFVISPTAIGETQETQLARVTVNWGACARQQHLPATVVDIFKRHRAASSDVQGRECTYHYLPCGTCPNDEARVEAFCDDGGTGPEPDFSWCEPCR